MEYLWGRNWPDSAEEDLLVAVQGCNPWRVGRNREDGECSIPGTFFTGTYQLRHRDIVTGLQIAELMQSSAALPPEHSCEFDFGSLYQPDTLLNRCTLLQTQSRSRKRAMVPLVSRRFSLATCFCVALLAYALGRIRV